MRLIVLIMSLVAAASVAAQPAQQNPPTASQANVPPPVARHLVMFTRAGPNFAKAREHLADVRAHQALYVRLAAQGHTIAGGAFEGEPSLGMTVFSEGIDEARARELIADDQLPRLGIVEYEFRTLGVRQGTFSKKK